MFHAGKRHEPVHAAAGSLARLLLGLGIFAAGCGFWDDFRARDYSIKSYFVHEDPLQVLADKTSDGNKRARALGSLREPKQNGGTQQEQDVVVKALVTAASNEQQAWCRIRAIESLGTFKDPRAIEGLKDAYYKAEAFVPETRKDLRCQILTALGHSQSPEAIDLLVSVLQAPPPEAATTSEQDRQYYLDERIAAAGALRNFKQSRAVAALAQVLKNDKDTALRDEAHHSLEVATGKKLPADFKAWDELLYPTGNPGRDAVAKEKSKATIGPPILQTGGGKPAP
ncbi:MAG: HEAT repeat domain-containing protein [Planctomycetes bacterium]|nr:HEAT repeat domain-containing protein [Planctomycetota bacterium]